MVLSKDVDTNPFVPNLVPSTHFHEIKEILCALRIVII